MCVQSIYKTEIQIQCIVMQWQVQNCKDGKVMMVMKMMVIMLVMMMVMVVIMLVMVMMITKVASTSSGIMGEDLSRQGTNVSFQHHH